MASHQEIKKFLETDLREKVKSFSTTQLFLNSIIYATLLLFIFGILGVIYLFAVGADFSFGIFFIIFFDILLMIVMVITISQSRKKFGQRYIHEIVLPFIKKYYPSLTYDPHSFIGETEAKNIGINPFYESKSTTINGNTFSGNTLISGIFNNSFIRISNIRLTNRRVRKTYRSHKTTIETTYEGIASVFEANGLPEFKIIYKKEKGFFSDRINVDGKEEEAGILIFEKDSGKKGSIKIYSNDIENTKRLFNESMNNQLIEIFSAYNQKAVRIRTKNNIFYLSVQDKILFDFHKKININVSNPELINDFSEFLNLNKILQIIFNIKH